MQSLYFSAMLRRAPSVTGGPIPAFFLYAEPARPPDEAIVHVETIAARSRQYHWIIQPHRHRDLHQVLILREGHVEARLDDRRVRAAAPCVLLIPPNAVHAFHFAVGTKGLVVTFAGGLIEDFVRGSEEVRGFLELASLTRLTRRNRVALDLNRLCEMLLVESRRASCERDLAMRGLIAAVIAKTFRLSGRRSATSISSNGKDRALIRRFRHAIEGHLREHVSVAGYCQILGVSEHQLRRACSRVNGCPPVSLIHERMLVEAERNLRYTGMNIKQIAYHLGFEDPTYFTRFFHRRTGCSPKAFRHRYESAELLK